LRAVTDLVLLHGGGHGSWCWGPLLEEWKTLGFPFERTFALDTPGAGAKRGQSTAHWKIATLAQSLNDELRAARVRGATFIGHSLAGVLMPAMAAEDPSLFAELIYLQTSAPLDGQTIMQQMADIAGASGKPDQTRVARLRRLFGLDLSEEMLRWMVREASQDATPPALATEPIDRRGYDSSHFRTAYVVALRDPILPTEWQRRFAQRLGARQIIEIDTPHEPFLSHPKLLIERLAPLLVNSVPAR
jgi:pimeloyl-ACP methyl ester carboxylesterase